VRGSEGINVTSVYWKSEEFKVFGLNSNWKDVPGVYAYCQRNATSGAWEVLYVGQAESFRDRLPNHERERDARRRGATHVLASVVNERAKRSRLEADMIRELQPPLNTHLR
jgi:excinuclease UvrABC nuclease subunit